MKNKILIVGPLLEAEKGKVISQGTILANYLSKQSRLRIIKVGKHPDRLKRIYETFSKIVTNRDSNLAIVLVFSGKSFMYADFASLLLRKFNIPIVFWLHGGALPEFSKKYKTWVKNVLNRGRILVAPSEYLTEYFSKIGFKNTRIIRNIIDIKSYKFKEKPILQPKFLWMRKFHPIWNPKMALHVFKNILSIYPEATLVMAGADEGYMGECIKISKKLGIYEQIKFPGFLDHEQKVKYMHENDIYLHTNLIDNVPVSVIEALASGMIVVGTRVGGMPHIIKDGINGFLVKSNDIESMTEKIIDILSGKYNIQSLQENGYKTAQEFHYEKVVNKWIELIKEFKQ